MLKVIIVDDEMLIRIGIKSCLEWEKYGFEIIGQAEDGIKAVELVERLLPDIVLTDIRMPNMDGLELISTIKERYPHIKVIVLSCYNEMEYVKRAMKLGAEDYILKLSMQPEILLEVLNRTKQIIEKDREKEIETKNYENKMRINRYIIKEDLYKRVFDGCISPEEFKKELENLRTRLMFKCYIIIYCSIDEYHTATIQSRMEDKNLLKFSFINIFEEILEGFCKGDIIEFQSGEFAIIMDFDNSYSEKELERKVANYCQKVNAAVKKYLNISVSFGIANNTDNISRISENFFEAQSAMEHKFYFGKESILFYKKLTKFIDKEIFFNFDDENLLLNYIEILDEDRVMKVINKFIDDLHNSKAYSPEKIKMTAVEILHIFIKIAKKYDFKSEFANLTNNIHPVNFLMSMENIQDIKSWFGDFIHKFIDDLTDVKSSIARPEIIKIKSYILEHIEEDITLDRASKICSIGKCYFSSIFKRETGESFTDYINRVKMEKARELLQRSDIKIYEVAELVGISDESYFSKLFKKHFGINPSKVK